MFRRKGSDPERNEALALFRPVAQAVDGAQRALLQAVPTYRNPGAPLIEALDGFEVELAAIESSMPSWRTAVTEEIWLRCERALSETRAAARSLRSSPPGPKEFEALNARLGDVLAPLEEFAEAERRILGKPV